MFNIIIYNEYIWVIEGYNLIHKNFNKRWKYTSESVQSKKTLILHFKDSYINETLPSQRPLSHTL